MVDQQVQMNDFLSLEQLSYQEAGSEIYIAFCLIYQLVVCHNQFVIFVTNMCCTSTK
jgi:hypothetical protein